MKRSGLANSLSGVGGSFSERNNWRSNKGHGAKLEQKEGLARHYNYCSLLLTVAVSRLL